MVLRNGLPGLLLALSVSAAAAPSPTRVPLRESSRVERVVWPVFLVARGPADGCDGLDPDSIEVLEGGEPVRVTRVDRERRPILHTILIDTSGSMEYLDRLSSAKEAARQYIDSLGPDATVMLLTFDESLILRAPPTRLRDTADRRRLHEAIDAIGLGSATQMRDALYQTARYLEHEGRRKVVILLTDGFDSASRITESRLRGAVTSHPGQNLTIFPIDLSGRELAANASVAPFVRAFLADLARTTGGKHYELQDARRLPEIFQDVRERLEREAYVTWEPRPFGALKQDPVAEGYGFRRVRIHANSDRCRVRNLKPHRFVQADEPGVPFRQSTEGVADGAGQRFPLPLSDEFAAVDPRKSYLIVERDRLRGRTVDLVFEAGLLYPRGAGRPREFPPAQAVHALRDFEIVVPPAPGAGDEPFTEPGQILRYWMTTGVAPVIAVEDRPYGQSPAVLHGSTLFEIRPWIARALFEQYPDYRDWLRDRLGRALEERLHRTHPDLSNEQVDRLRRARVADPTAGDLAEHLGAWLGDVDAADAARALERDAIDRLLTASAAAEPAALAEARQIAEAWPDLALWFGPPDRSRILTPLILMHDPQSQRIGFYRFVLPRPDSNEQLRGTVPEAPLALESLLAAWEPTGRDALRQRYRARAVEYAGGGDLVGLTLRLESVPDAGTGPAAAAARSAPAQSELGEPVTGAAARSAPAPSALGEPVTGPAAGSGSAPPALGGPVIESVIVRAEFRREGDDAVLRVSCASAEPAGEEGNALLRILFGAGTPACATPGSRP